MKRKQIFISIFILALICMSLCYGRAEESSQEIDFDERRTNMSHHFEQQNFNPLDYIPKEKQKEQRK